MNFIELIGFLISLFGLFFLMVKQTLETRRRRTNPEEEERREAEQTEKLRLFLTSIYEEPKEEKKPIPLKTAPPKPRLVDEDNEQRKSLSHFEYAPHARDAYTLNKKREISRGAKLLHTLKTPKEMVILQEIISPPTSLRGNSRDML